jgi:hypothetical protein
MTIGSEVFPKRYWKKCKIKKTKRHFTYVLFISVYLNSHIKSTHWGCLQRMRDGTWNLVKGINEVLEKTMPWGASKCILFTRLPPPLLAQQPLVGQRPPHRGFTSHKHTTLGRTPLDEWSALNRDLYLTTHNTHERKTSMPPAGFEPTIPVRERPLTHTLDIITIIKSRGMRRDLIECTLLIMFLCLCWHLR